MLGTPALPPDFPYFPYVNPNAPKGGEVTLAAIGTFDSFNPFILRGTAAAGMVDPWVGMPGGSEAGSTVGHVWESLLTPSADEIATAYCHICKTVEMPADRSWIAFNLRPEARFSDGVPLTAEDVAWTFRTLMTEGRPSFRIQMADVTDVVVESPTRVVFHLRPNENRALPLILGGLPVLPEHWFKGRDFSDPLREAPIGSGPYRIAEFHARPQRDLPARPELVGAGLADRARDQQFRYGAHRVLPRKRHRDGGVQGRPDRSAVGEHREALGDRTTIFRRCGKGLVIKADIRHHLPTGMEGWAMNTRRPMFSNPLVRQALAVAYDFEWANKNLFYDRVHPYAKLFQQQRPGLVRAA